mmetsp:Transcript_9921/g.21794  ORF Transcript_9921/g.21794 Transcript_9921/m.21794 type:complete len:379 (+) Transcript_9921:81-1217(+)
MFEFFAELHICWVATLWGLICGASLPIGAIAGIVFGKLSKYTQGTILAFGAGFALYAVTIGIYAVFLGRINDNVDRTTAEINVAAISALLGALTYLWGNRKLNQVGELSEEERQEEIKKNAQQGWKDLRQKVGAAVVTSKFVQLTNAERSEARRYSLERRDSSAGMSASAAGVTRAALAMQAGSSEEEQKEGTAAAFALFLGSFMDGIPEAVLLGFLTAQGNLQIVFVLALFIANFPESTPSAAMLNEAGVNPFKIVGMWTLPCLVMGAGAGLACAAMPADVQGSFAAAMVVAVVSGLAAGALMAMITTVMLVEAFEACGDHSGITTLVGFLAAVMLAALFTYGRYHYGAPVTVDEASDIKLVQTTAQVFLRMNHVHG